MNKVRVTVESSFTYQYGSKVSHVICGAILYYNPSLENELEELKYVMDSVYLKKGFISVEQSIKEDFKNKAGIFAEKTIVSEQVSSNTVIEKEVDKKESLQPKVLGNFKLSLEDRKSQLEDLKAAEIRVIAEDLCLVEYTNKAAAIDYILKVEYPE